MSHQRLRLRARDADDLAILATVLQDAIVPLTDVAYVPGEKRFAFVANRFLWETAPVSGHGGRRQSFLRVNCGVVFDGVTGVKSRGLDLNRRDRMLDLLTIALDDRPDLEPDGDPKVKAGSEAAGARVSLLFSDDTDIRLAVESLDVRLTDLGEPWPTAWRPNHDAAGQPDG